MRNNVVTARTRHELLNFASELADLAVSITSNVKAAGGNVDALQDVFSWTVDDTFMLAHSLKARKKPLFSAASKYEIKVR